MNMTRAADTRSHAVSPLFVTAGGAGAGAPAAFSTGGAALSAARAGTATPAARMRTTRQSRIAEVPRRYPIILIVLPAAAVASGIRIVVPVCGLSPLREIDVELHRDGVLPAGLLLVVDVVPED